MQRRLAPAATDVRHRQPRCEICQCQRPSDPGTEGPAASEYVLGILAGGESLQEFSRVESRTGSYRRSAPALGNHALSMFTQHAGSRASTTVHRSGAAAELGASAAT